MEKEEIDKLELELQSTLLKVKKHTRILNLFKVLSYGGSIVYFLGIFISFNILIYTHSQWFDQIDNTTILYIIIPLFVLIIIGTLGTSYYYSKYIQTEQQAIQKIIKTILPSGQYSFEKGAFSISKLMLSGFFGNIQRDKISAYSLGELKLSEQGSTITINDIGLKKSTLMYWLSKSSVGTFITVVIYMFRGIFSKRMEDITLDFRGMFSTVSLKKNIGGIVIIVPDKLEKHMDYLADNIQKLKNRDGIELIKMEDVEFEHAFTVYSSDDTLARYILTPSRMRKMVELKKRYDKDIMISYAFNHFYAAINIPEGLLGLDNTKIAKGNSVNNFYNNVCLSRSMMNLSEI
ncbi:DUF3137 domain-containing protein [Myroides profundi]|uniref:DUF3137 domain-containing protein n=2 Tax=Myroides TaxID=76831 RepID=A0AAJ4W6P6_MYRPR|nr:DUF3137 domain-containing protein [Myroides profundi]AJH15351.1 hypothetical protein MPR_2180 [Myroides profundi]SER55628.1 Protein of unknown function [Myroides profundi]